MEEELVLVSVSRLRELEAAAAALPVVTAKLAKRAHNNIERLKAYNKANPERKKERDRRYITQDREAYNAKRREYRKKVKERKAAEAAAAAEPPGDDTVAAVTPAT